MKLPKAAGLGLSYSKWGTQDTKYDEALSPGPVKLAKQPITFLFGI